MAGLDERRRFREVVDHERGLRVAVVHGRQRGEAFLARRVPDLELDGARRQGDFFRQKGRADRWLFVRLEVVVYEAQDERGLPWWVSW